jgi:hypothetical protein
MSAAVRYGRCVLKNECAIQHHPCRGLRYAMEVQHPPPNQLPIRLVLQYFRSITRSRPPCESMPVSVLEYGGS